MFCTALSFRLLYTRHARCSRSPSTVLVTLTQVTPPSLSGAVCPGKNLVYLCNSTASFNVRWRSETGVDEIDIQSTSNLNFTDVGDFMVQVVNRTYNPNSIVSTATLENANFSNNNITIECLALQVDHPNLNDSAVVLVSGN